MWLLNFNRITTFSTLTAEHGFLCFSKRQKRSSHGYTASKAKELPFDTQVKPDLGRLSQAGPGHTRTTRIVPKTCFRLLRSIPNSGGFTTLLSWRAKPVSSARRADDAWKKKLNCCLLKWICIWILLKWCITQWLFLNSLLEILPIFLKIIIWLSKTKSVFMKDFYVKQKHRQKIWKYNVILLEI